MSTHNDIGHRLTILARDLRTAEMEAGRIILFLHDADPYQLALLRSARERTGLAAAGVAAALENHGAPEPQEDEPEPEFETQRVLSALDADFAANAAAGDRFK